MINNASLQTDINNAEQNFSTENLLKDITENTILDTKDILEYPEKMIRRLLRWAIQDFIGQSDFSLFDKYKNHENNWLNKDVFDNKFEKYYTIHENILIEAFTEEYGKMIVKNKEERNNLIRNFISKYLYILFIFSEKIKISDLKTSIRFSLPKLADMYTQTSEHIAILESFGIKETEQLEGIYSDAIKESQSFTEKTNIFAKEMFLSSMYRYLHKKNSQHNSVDIAQEIAEWFEQNYKIAFSKMFYIFATWAESGYQKTQEGLLNIEIVLRRLIDGMLFLKSKDIAFIDFPIKTIQDKHFLYAFSDRFVGDKYFDSYGPVFEKFIGCACLDDIQKKQQMYDEINIELEEIAKKKAQSRMPIETKRHDFVNVKRVLFDNWKHVLDAQKYEIVFSEVFAHDGIMHFPDFLQLDNKKYFQVFSEYFAIKQNISDENRKSYKEWLRKQLEDIRSSHGTKTLQEFIESDVNNLNFIVLWWRFVLKVRQVGNIPNLEKVLAISDAPYGITERISENLKDVIQEGKITFDPDGRIKNTSVKWTDAILMDLIKGLKKGFIDISEEEIVLTNKESQNFGKIRAFYLPPWVGNEILEPQEEINKIRDYIDAGIDALFALLQKKKINNEYQNQYIQNLIDAKVLPEWELSQDILEKIQDLVELLKFTKNRIKHIQSMLDIADKDTETLKENGIINEILSHDEESGFWPRKKFSRAFEKLMAEYGGNFNEIGDFTRLRVMVDDNPDDMVKQVTNFVRAAAGMKEVTHVTVTDKTGEPISIPMKASGYRDTKVLLKMQSGNTVEVQFQYRSMYDMKDKWLDLLSQNGERVFEKMKKEESLFETEELRKFLQYSLRHNIELPKREILEKLMKSPKDNIEWKKYEELLIKLTISMDDTYHITRTLDEKDSIRAKFTRLERVLADIAQSKIVLNYLQGKWVKLQ